MTTILCSIAPTTLVQYDSSFKRWWNFCNKHGFSPFSVDISIILQFFQNLLEETNCKFGTFNSHKAALAMILPDGALEHQVLKRFFKGIFRSRPPNPKYESTWNPHTVLSYLESISTDELKNLSLKLVTLLLLSTGQRIQTISLIEMDNIKEDEMGIKIFIPKLIKTSAPNRPQPRLVLPFMKENIKLCVAKTLKDYIARTREFRSNNCSQLFISFRRPFGAVSKQTLSRWVKCVLKNAGIDVSMYKAHSTRHASTSLAFAKGLSIDIIRKTAGWTPSSATFARFYNRPMDQSGEFLLTVFEKD